MRVYFVNSRNVRIVYAKFNSVRRSNMDMESFVNACISNTNIKRFYVHRNSRDVLFCFKYKSNKNISMKSKNEVSVISGILLSCELYKEIMILFVVCKRTMLIKVERNWNDSASKIIIAIEIWLHIATPIWCSQKGINRSGLVLTEDWKAGACFILLTRDSLNLRATNKLQA